jgi:hypothetical protein
MLPPTAASSGSLWQRRWWIDKTARLLRGGEGLGPDDDIDALLRLPEQEIARRFMRDPRFGDTILDFNMYFLGFKTDQLKSDGVYTRNAFDFANAVASAQALLTGGDYFRLFDFEGDFFMPPLRNWPHEDPPQPADAGLSPQEMRSKAAGEIKAVLADLAAFAASQPPPARDDLCERVEAVVLRRDDLTTAVYRAFDDAEIFVLVRGRVISAPIDTLDQALDERCEQEISKSPEADVGHLAAAARAASERLGKAFAEILNFEPARYKPRSVLEFRRFDLNAFANTPKWLAFGFEQAVALQNSSTNFNRKRSAYVLKRFFCDDLTPVGFEEPQEHVGGAHGSTTSCYACHYKLDPMAGFFRSLGWKFNDFKSRDHVTFDDQAEAARRDYDANWRARAGSGRSWNIGYIRSPRWEDRNSYGESFSDLSRIVRSAPEAKRCLMRRLFEYMTAENQTIDGGYLDQLTRAFEAEAAESSAEAMKNAIVRVLQSETYRQPNPDPERCYDRAAGAGAGKGPPCRVAFILQKNCAQCHSSAVGGRTSLDLSAWVPAPDGKSLTFPHLGHDKRQLPAEDTMTRIMQRLSSTDAKVRMPKNRLMSDQERQQLYLWAQDELSRMSKDSPP